MTRKNRTNAAGSAGTDNKKKDVSSDAPLILVVDDYQDAREMCSEYLRFSGFRVEEAADGVEAIEKATENLPAAILMDLSLPRLDGWEATRRLKKDARTRHIPVIALTGHALAGHSEGAADAGCDSFLTKPCLPDRMVEEVKRILERAGSSGAASEELPEKVGESSRPTATGRSNKR